MSDGNDNKIIWIQYAIIHVYYIQDTLVHSCQRHILCDIPSTIKDDEHDHRTAKQSHSHSHNIVLTPEPTFLGEAEFLGFVVNHAN